MQVDMGVVWVLSPPLRIKIPELKLTIHLYTYGRYARDHISVFKKYLNLNSSPAVTGGARLSSMFWWFGAMETPVPIPNTAVKRSCGDDSPIGRK